jgi:hypothetical protein
LQVEALALVCSVVTDVRTICAALCTSSSARQAILATCSGILQLQIAPYTQDGQGSNSAAAVAASLSSTAAALTRVDHQAAWLAEYGALVGEVQLWLNSSLRCADAAALQAALRPPLQLRHLRLSATRPAALLKQLEPSNLTSLVIELTPADVRSAVSQLLGTALGRLTSLRQLSITGDESQPHGSMAAALAGMTQLTQLLLQPLLSAAALAQLPGQLVELHLSGPDCDATELTSHVGALLHLQTLKLTYGASAAPALLLNHAPAWCNLAPLRQLSVVGCGAEHNADVLSGIAAATNITKLSCRFGLIGRGAALAVLSSLRQLEELKLEFSPNVDSFYSWGQLLSQHLTQLRSLDVQPGKMRQLAHMQLLFHPTQLTQLVLREVPLDDQDYEVIVANLTQLRRLALIECGTLDNISSLIPLPRLPHLEQFAITNTTYSANSPRMIWQQRIKRMRPRLFGRVAQFPWNLPAGFVGHTLQNVFGW